ncbi:short-subunit dehydrogenase [Roseiarcus fermentans]|uniref:Short-subunit dehydrogenase n=1 Tax=Roseiarcus fermentans TaxID=1473586 RepID=A0A366EL57_9HYPH|nr:SDR family oxidoreductase [Roseiarcus fermentans]RBP02706.1 short-subunit dehydrogenase [Roseiarcus fermentans]
MSAFITGGTGFIGKRLVRKLLERSHETIHVLVRKPSPELIDGLVAFWGDAAKRVQFVEGDISRPDLGVAQEDARKLRGRIDHFFHLAAVYDLKAEPAQVIAANVAGVANALSFAKSVKAGCFHHVSSIAAAGLYAGVFREDMFEEARGLDHPYYASKHKGEALVRKETEIPWRIYRPGAVVGDSKTGEIDKIDGPYYFFKLIQKLRDALPSWVPMVGLEGGRINVVPVDFVVAAMDYLAHLDGLDGRAFHLTDPSPMRVGDMLNTIAKAAHAPAFTMRINAGLFGLAPKALTHGLMGLTPFRRMRKQLMKELGLPDDIFMFVNYPTRFDCRETQKLLQPAGIEVPAFSDYAWRLWDYWERHLDPALFVDRSLRGAVGGKRALVTGGSAGIGRAIAHRLAEAGAKTLIVARDVEKLELTRQEFAAQGLEVHTYSADISDPAQCAALIETIRTEHGGIDILINNAGRSIRRSVENSYDRLHDVERLIRLNYLAAVQLTMGFLPGMAERRAGHVVNISSIGVLTTAPRFSAYVGSKAALEGWSDCAASEFLDRGVAFTNVNMPLVRTEMIAPTKLYQHVPTLDTDEAAALVVDAIVDRPARVATRLGLFGKALHAIAPSMGRIVLNTAFRMFPESAAARGEQGGEAAPSADQIAFTQLLKGLHL